MKARTIKVAGLNIAMHKPHSSERYNDLLEDVYKHRLMLRTGVHGMMIGSLKPTKRDDPSFGVSGEFFKFIQLDPNEPWYNAETQEEATEDEVNEIQIPNHMLPHLSRIPFTFTAHNHQLWFVNKDRRQNLSAKKVEDFFVRAFENEVIVKNYPDIAVTVIPDSKGVEEMLSLGTISKMTIELKRPNPDDGDDDEALFLGKLEKMKAKSLKTELSSERNQAIEPDDEIKRLAVVASNNGRVQVSGRDRDGSYSKSTEDIPLIQSVRVDNQTGDAISALQSFLRIF